MNSRRVGVDCTANLNTGTFGAPTWAPILLARGVEINLTGTQADASDRTSALKAWMIGQIDAEVTINCNDNLGNTVLASLRTTFLARSATAVDLAFADGGMATSGVQWVRCQFVITDINRGEDLDGVATVDITIKPAVSAGITQGTV